MRLNITKYRRMKRLSMLELSKQLNISRSYMSELESGKYANPSLSIICKLCKVLDCTPDELIDCQNGKEE